MMEATRIEFIYSGSERSIPKNITHVTIDPSVQEVLNGAFSGCTQLVCVGVGEGLERIGSQAFIGCTSLTNMIVPFTVKKIGDGAFKGCTQLIC